jgi:hypothetical protein
VGNPSKVSLDTQNVIVDTLARYDRANKGKSPKEAFDLVCCGSRFEPKAVLADTSSNNHPKQSRKIEAKPDEGTGNDDEAVSYHGCATVSLAHNV